MKLCDTCGNEIPEQAWKCPYCETQQYSGESSRPRRSRKVLTLNLKDGLPSTEQALERMERELAAATADGVKVVRLVHGYGASGKGGQIRQTVLRHLQRQGHSLGVRKYIPGDEYSEDTNAGREALAAHPALRGSLKSDQLNPGMTLVLL